MWEIAVNCKITAKIEQIVTSTNSYRTFKFRKETHVAELNWVFDELFAGVQRTWRIGVPEVAGLVADFLLAGIDLISTQAAVRLNQ